MDGNLDVNLDVGGEKLQVQTHAMFQIVSMCKNVTTCPAYGY